MFEKTRFCKFHARGRCRRGTQCTFAHSNEELQPRPDYFKTQLCVDFFRNASCTMAELCRYAHSPEEVRRIRHVKDSAPEPRQDSAARARGPRRDERSSQMQREAPLQPQDDIEAVRAQLMAVERQLDALQHARVAALTEQSWEATSHTGTDSAKAATDTNFSRQSTQEGSPIPDALTPVARQKSEDLESELWCDEILQHELAPETMVMTREPMVKCELVVKRTFLSLEPSNSDAIHSCCRARSTPAYGRSGPRRDVQPVGM